MVTHRTLVWDWKKALEISILVASALVMSAAALDEAQSAQSQVTPVTTTAVR